MEIVLAIALVLTNLVWAWLFNERDKRELDERRELQNRIVKPDKMIPKVHAAPKQELSDFDKISATDMRELAAVGSIDPELSRDDG